MNYTYLIACKHQNWLTELHMIIIYLQSSIKKGVLLIQ